MLSAHRKRLRDALGKAQAQVSARNGPTVPPSGHSRLDFLRRMRRAEQRINEIDELIGGLADPEYPAEAEDEDPK